MALPASVFLSAVAGFGIALGIGLLILALAPVVIHLATRKRYPTVTPGGAVLITGSSTGESAGAWKWNA
jgi:hypothetical protein